MGTFDGNRGKSFVVVFLGEKLKRKKTSIPPTFQRFSDKTK
jgi:hypothetical protein